MARIRILLAYLLVPGYIQNTYLNPSRLRILPAYS